MATGQDLLAGIKQYYPYIDTNDGGLLNMLNQRASQGATLDQILGEVPGYSQTSQGANSQAQGLFGTQYNLGLNKLGQDQTDVNRYQDSLAESLRQAAVGSRGTLTENFNNLGLLQSGMTAAGLGDVEKTLNKGLAESEADRASKLANLAIQRSGLTANYTQSVNDYVQKLLSQSQGLVDERSTPAQTVDLGNRVIILNKKGEVIGQYAKGSLAGSGGGSTDPVIAALLEKLGFGNGGTAGGGDANGNGVLDEFEALTASTPITSVPIPTAGSVLPGGTTLQGGGQPLQGSGYGLQGSVPTLQGSGGNSLQGGGLPLTGAFPVRPWVFPLQ